MSDFITKELKELNYMKKRPEKVYFKGNLELLEKRKIAIVGSRKPIAYTKQFTHQLAAKLSSYDIAIVSGAAMGVDAISHNAANKNTIAVMANGLNIKYPKTNTNLIKKIEEQALCLSMFEDDYKAKVYSFVQRNELVVALSEALIITQADKNSGSLHSANFALKQNKKIYVLAHRIGDSEGTCELIKNNLAEAIYDIDEFIHKIIGNNIKTQKKDDILDYFDSNPELNNAIKKFGTKIFEYELEGKIKIENGIIYKINY